MDSLLSSSVARTRPAPPLAARGGCSFQKSAELHGRQGGEDTPSSAQKPFLFSQLLWYPATDPRLDLRNEDDSSGQMASLVNSACLIFLPAALLLGKYKNIEKFCSNVFLKNTQLPLCGVVVCLFFFFCKFDCASLCASG